MQNYYGFSILFRNRGGKFELDTADAIAEETRQPIEKKESGKSYFNMSPRESESVMQQAVRNQEKDYSFVTLFDNEGRMYRRYDDGRVEYVRI